MSYATAVTWLFSKFRFPTGFEHSPPLTLLYLKRLHRRSHLPQGTPSEPSWSSSSVRLLLDLNYLTLTDVDQRYSSGNEGFVARRARPGLLGSDAQARHLPPQRCPVSTCGLSSSSPMRRADAHLSPAATTSASTSCGRNCHAANRSTTGRTRVTRLARSSPLSLCSTSPFRNLSVCCSLSQYPYFTRKVQFQGSSAFFPFGRAPHPSVIESASMLFGLTRAPSLDVQQEKERERMDVNATKR